MSGEEQASIESIDIVQKFEIIITRANNFGRLSAFTVADILKNAKIHFIEIKAEEIK